MTAGPQLHLPGKVDTGRTIALDYDVACPPRRATVMWVVPAEVRRFLAPEARIDGRVGGAYTAVFYPSDDPQGVRYGTSGARLLANRPGRLVAFEWITFATDRLKGDGAPPFAEPSLRLADPFPTWVEVAVSPRPGGSHVAFRHYGFGAGEPWDESRAWFTRAWRGVMERLREACAA